MFRKHTEESREKIKKALTGRPHSVERKAAIKAGCQKFPIVEIGARINSWEIIGPPISEHNQWKYLCRCVCGTVTRVAATHLRRGNSSQCVKCVGISNTRRAAERSVDDKGRPLYVRTSNTRLIWVRARFVELYKEQSGLCPICTRPLKEDFSDACIDHDHRTMVIRGMVHRGCNILIGWFDRVPDIAERVRVYMEKAK